MFGALPHPVSIAEKRFTFFNLQNVLLSQPCSADGCPAMLQENGSLQKLASQTGEQNKQRLRKGLFSGVT